MNSYRDLEVYQLSRTLANEVHKVSLQLPKFELYEEGQQVRRSSKAVTSAIVEGFARRRYKKDYVKYLVYAQSECDETIVHLDFIIDSHTLENQPTLIQLRVNYEVLSKKINKYLAWVEDHFFYKSSAA